MSESATTSDDAPVALRADLLPMAGVPLLGFLALGSALVDHLGNRLVLRALTIMRGAASIEHGTLVGLGRMGDLARNLAAIAGIVALVAALIEFILPRPYVSARRRLGVAAFAGVFLPTIALSTVLPSERTTPQVVLFAAGAANVLVALLGSSTLQWRGPRLLRVGIGLLTLTSLLAFSALVVLLVGTASMWQSGYPIGMGLRRLGELTYILAFLLVGLAAWPRDRGRVAQLFIAALSALVALLPPLLLSSLRGGLEPESFRSLLYGALHFEALLEEAPLAYVSLASIGLGLGVAGLFGGRPAGRQLGAATLLLVAAGYAPSTPVTLLTMVLGVALAVRSLVAQSTSLAAAEAAADFAALSRELDEASE